MEQGSEIFQEQALTKASSCEAELQDLVHQVDIIVNSKKVEWERKMKAFEAQMDIQHQELASAQSKLDQKGQEVELLCQQLENLQKTNCEMAQNYETQLCALKSQFLKLTHSYDKLLKQKNRQSREISKESPETSFQLNNLNKKLEEFKAKSREWDKKGTICQNHLIYLDAQQRLLSEKCNLFQISNKKQNQEEIIKYGQPEREKDGLVVEKLRAAVSEMTISRNRLEEENLKLREDLKMFQSQCQNIEASFLEMRNELQSRDALWRKIQLECQQLRAELLKIREHKDVQEMHRSSFVQLTEQSENKNADLLLQAQNQNSQREVLSKIRNHLYREEPSHCSEQERIRTEISDLTEELHQKEITIATIMEKASLLERRLKTELQIKDKLLAKQQLLNFRYKVIKSENTHLKEIMENQKYKSCMSIDLSNKKHGDFTASIQKLEHENARLQNSLVKLQNHAETLMLSGVDKHGETEHSYQTHSKMQEKEERTFQNEDERHMKLQQTAIFTASEYHRNCSPTSHGQGDISGSKSDRTLSHHKLDRGREMELDDKSPSPATEHPLCFGGLFPEKGRTGILLSHAYDAEEIKLPSSPETSFLATTEKFLQEEEKHTKEFEERLNSHLEELQRLSENTLKKYTGLQQSVRGRAQPCRTQSVPQTAMTWVQDLGKHRSSTKLPQGLLSKAPGTSCPEGLAPRRGLPKKTLIVTASIQLQQAPKEQNVLCSHLCG
ncbi:deuterosome assembly protein 1 isoform X2 [Phasianus colchicus]|uniref:deuterosome assembly protein 1 isoform X2 n=1 Tax=Phasianus colchicus TaxID=9054 RepID=UPI00129DBD10|nr:deuterosome assembly protein 1 isoform X2 [Phasianus colchicus]